MISWIFIVQSHWNNSPWVDMLLHSNTLFWFQANPFLFFLLNAACLTEKQHMQIFEVIGLTRPTEIGICYFSARHATLRKKSKDWFAWNQNNVSEWSDMSTHGLLFQRASTIKIQLGMLVKYNADINISFKCNFWKAHLAFNNNHSFIVWFHLKMMMMISC